MINILKDLSSTFHNRHKDQNDACMDGAFCCISWSNNPSQLMFSTVECMPKTSIKVKYIKSSNHKKRP